MRGSKRNPWSQKYCPDYTLPDRLRRTVDTMVYEMGPDQIVLFGSLACGYATDASDIDLSIIVQELFQNGQGRFEMMTQLLRALSKSRGPKLSLVYSRDEVEKWGNASNHSLARALREGRCSTKNRREEHTRALLEMVWKIARALRGTTDRDLCSGGRFGC